MGCERNEANRDKETKKTTNVLPEVQKASHIEFALVFFAPGMGARV